MGDTEVQHQSHRAFCNPHFQPKCPQTVRTPVCLLTGYSRTFPCLWGSPGFLSEHPPSSTSVSNTTTHKGAGTNTTDRSYLSYRRPQHQLRTFLCYASDKITGSTVRQVDETWWSQTKKHGMCGRWWMDDTRIDTIRDVYVDIWENQRLDRLYQPSPFSPLSRVPLYRPTESKSPDRPVTSPTGLPLNAHATHVVLSPPFICHKGTTVTRPPWRVILGNTYGSTKTHIILYDSTHKCRWLRPPNPRMLHI